MLCRSTKRDRCSSANHQIKVLGVIPYAWGLGMANLVIIPCPSTLNEKSRNNFSCKIAPNVIPRNYYLLRRSRVVFKASAQTSVGLDMRRIEAALSSYTEVSILNLSDFFELKSMQRYWVKLCSTKFGLSDTNQQRNDESNDSIYFGTVNLNSNVYEHWNFVWNWCCL